ncbi:hypothetical protein GQ55_2G386600 [Panicum hallii var. hallii]|uniref:histidine kinase n=1 Tax=Panicum hallii var. hallii TaxID=1504633 RepID=A0A2T7EWZ8_9POAL|nr:hypothetical protein GQ55_2G386600 [Panicum hallii var. hallii]
MAARCGGGGCDGREDGAVEALLQWQKVSDFLIGASYLSIPLELLHFATCADLAPLRWVLLQFGAFTVLCGIVHLAAVLTYARPDSRRLLLAFTAAKALAALAASVAAVSLPTFIPQLLRLKTREALLRDKARQLDRDVALVRRRQETAARVVRAITQHVRRGGAGGSLPHDAHAVLRTAVLHLSEALGLCSCAVWMPAAASNGSSVLHLVHQLPEDDHRGTTRQAIRVSDPDVAAVMASKDAKVLRPGSALGTTTGRGAAAAIRMPLLRVSNFVDASSSGSDEQGAAVSYAIMVLVLAAPPPTPKNHISRRHRGGRGAREWIRQELDIVEVVADQLAVALSHAAVLEEWQLTRYKLAERQRVLAQARHDAEVATRARDAPQGAMRDGVLRPMHSVAGLLSLMQAQQQDEALPCAERRLAVGAMARISALSSTLIDDVMAAVLTPTTPCGDPTSAAAAGVSLARRPFDLRRLVRDAAAVSVCLARCRGIGFSHRAEMSSLPGECWVVGDDRRVFHLLLHMLGALLDRCECHCHDLCFSVETVVGEQDPAMSDHRDWITPNFSGCNMVCVKFRFGITRILRDSLLRSSSPRPHDRIKKSISTSSETRLSITTCSKIVQMMNGKMWRESPSDFGGQQGESMSLILHFQLGYGLASPSASSPSGAGFYRTGGAFGATSTSPSSTTAPPQYHFNGLRILLVDSDDTSREVTRKLLERLGCQVLPVPSAAHCLSLLLGSDAAAAAADQPPFQFPYLQLQVVFLDLHTPASDAGGAADDGFEVALRIRELTSDSFSWLLILVAVPLPPRASCIDVRDACQRTGVNGVIPKPITLPALGAHIYRALHNDN